MPQDMGLPGAYGADAFTQAFTEMLAKQAAAKIQQQRLLIDQQRAADDTKRADFQQRLQEQDLTFRTTDAQRRLEADQRKEREGTTAETDFTKQIDAAVQAGAITPQQGQQAKLIRSYERASGGHSTTGLDTVFAPKPTPAGSTFDQLFTTQKALAAKKLGIPVEQLTPEDIAAAQRAAVKASSPAVPSQGSEFDQVFGTEKQRLAVLKGVAAEQLGPDDLATAQDKAIKRTHPVNADTELARNQARLDKSWTVGNSEILDMRKPIVDRTERLGRALASVNAATPQADALVAPELLTIMAGGVGSGVRMSEAEIARIVGGRSAWQTIQAAVNHWNTDQSKALSIQPEQRQQVRDLLQTVASRSQAQLDVLHGAARDLASATEVDAHRGIMNKTREQLDHIMLATGAEAGTKAQLPPINQRVVGKTQATINGTKMVWSILSPDGRTGWKPQPAGGQ